MTALRGGTFNLFNSRHPGVVLDEVKRLFDNHNLDFLCVQEFKDYRSAFTDAAWVNVFAAPWPGNTGRGDNAILVRKGVKTHKPVYKNYGDGWTTIEGTDHVASEIPRVSVDWLRVGVVHMATPITFGPPRPRGPSDRVDDYMACARKVRSYLTTSAPRIMAGDWNESVRTKAPWSPAWIARQAHATAYPTGRLAGHGDIDYPIGSRGVRITGVTKDLHLRENSDHEPVVFTVHKVGP